MTHAPEIHPHRIYVREQAYPAPYGVRFDVWGCYPNGDEDLISSLHCTRSAAERFADYRRCNAMLAALGAALEVACDLPVAVLRGLEGDWRLEAMSAEWLPEVEDCTARGAQLLHRADAVDLFLFNRPGGVAAPAAKGA